MFSPHSAQHLLSQNLHSPDTGRSHCTRCLRYVEDPVLSRTVHLAYTVLVGNQAALVLWVEIFRQWKQRLQTWKCWPQQTKVLFLLQIRTVEEAGREKRIGVSSVNSTAGHIQKQISTEPESTDMHLCINGSLSAENKSSTILFFTEQFRRFALNSFHSSPGL